MILILHMEKCGPRENQGLKKRCPYSCVRALVHDDAFLFHLSVQLKTFQGSLILLVHL